MQHSSAGLVPFWKLCNITQLLNISSIKDRARNKILRMCINLVGNGHCLLLFKAGQNHTSNRKRNKCHFRVAAFVMQYDGFNLKVVCILFLSSMYTAMRKRKQHRIICLLSTQSTVKAL